MAYLSCLGSRACMTDQCFLRGLVSVQRGVAGEWFVFLLTFRRLAWSFYCSPERVERYRIMFPTISYICGASLAIVVLRIIEYYITTFRLRKIPTVGSSSIFCYYSNALDFRRRAREIIQEGYDKVRVAFMTASFNKSCSTLVPHSKSPNGIDGSSLSAVI